MNHELTAHEAVSAVARDLEAKDISPTIVTDVLFVTAFSRLVAETRDLSGTIAIADQWAAVRALPIQGA